MNTKSQQSTTFLTSCLGWPFRQNLLRRALSSFLFLHRLLLSGLGQSNRQSVPLVNAPPQAFEIDHDRVKPKTLLQTIKNKKHKEPHKIHKKNTKKHKKRHKKTPDKNTKPPQVESRSPFARRRGAPEETSDARG